MRKFFLLLLLFSSYISSFSQVKVNGYYRKNGTYVQPHYRSSPDGNPYNNYSFPGNTNPYTGKTSTGNPNTYLYNYYNRKGVKSTNNNYSYNFDYKKTYGNTNYVIPHNYRERNYSTEMKIENRNFLLTYSGENLFLVSSMNNIPIGYIKIRRGKVKNIFDLNQKKVNDFYSISK